MSYCSEQVRNGNSINSPLTDKKSSSTLSSLLLRQKKEIVYPVVYLNIELSSELKGLCNEMNIFFNDSFSEGSPMFFYNCDTLL